MTIRYNTPFLRNLNKRRLSGLLLIYVLPTMIFSACQGQAPIQSADLVESNSIAAAELEKPQITEEIPTVATPTLSRLPRNTVKTDQTPIPTRTLPKLSLTLSPTPTKEPNMISPSGGMKKLKELLTYGSGSPENITLSSDDLWLVFSTMNVVHVYDYRTQKEVYQFQTIDSPVKIQFVPNSQLFWLFIPDYSSGTGTLEFYRTKDGQLEYSINISANEPPSSLVISKDGKTSYLSIYDPWDQKFSLYRWNLLSNTVENIFLSDTISSNVDPKVKIFPDEKIAYLSADDFVLCLDLETGTETCRVQTQEPVQQLAVAPDRTILAFAGTDDVRIWDFKKHEEITSFVLDQIKYYNEILSQVNPVSDTCTYKYSIDVGWDSQVSSMEFTPRGDRLSLVVGHEQQERDPKTGKLISVKNFQPETIRIPPEFPNDIYPIAFSSDGDLVAFHDSNDRLQVWNIWENKPILGIQSEADSLAFNGDNQRLAVANSGIKIIDLKTKIVQEFSGEHNAPVNKLIFSPDDKFLYTGSTDCTVKIWSIEQGKLVDTLPIGEFDITKMELSPNGEYLAVGDDSQLWIFSSGDKKIVQKLYDISDFSFVPDTNILLTLTSESVKRYDLKTRKEHELLSTTGYEMYLSPTGILVITNNENSLLYNLDTGVLTGQIPLDVGAPYFFPENRELLIKNENGVLTISGAR